MFTRSACVSWLRFVFAYPQDRLRYRSSLEGLSPGEMRRVHRHRRHAKHFEETPILRCLLLLLAAGVAVAAAAALVVAEEWARRWRRFRNLDIKTMLVHGGNAVQPGSRSGSVALS